MKKDDHGKRDADGTAGGKPADRIKRLFAHLRKLDLVLTPGTKIEIQKFADLFDEVGDHAILIVGDSGVGKSLFLQVFKFLYEDRSGKREIPEINCAHLNPQLSASTLFGYIKGAYTGATKDRAGFIETHNNGPIILEEIGVLAHDVQAQLLTVMESGKFYRVGDANIVRQANIQLIGATNDESQLRGDFLYRFHPFYLTSLYQRRDDILWFIWHMDQVFFRSLYTWDILILLGYNWPGNVRELERVVRTIKLLRKWSFRDSRPDIFRYHDFRISKINYSLQLFNMLKDNIDINVLERFLNQYNLGVVPTMNKRKLPFLNVTTNEGARDAIKTAYIGLHIFADLFYIDPYSNSDITDIWKAKCPYPAIIRDYRIGLKFPQGLQESIRRYMRPKLQNRLGQNPLEACADNLNSDQPVLKPETSLEFPDMFSMTLEELKGRVFVRDSEASWRRTAKSSGLGRGKPKNLQCLV